MTSKLCPDVGRLPKHHQERLLNILWQYATGHGKPTGNYGICANLCLFIPKLSCVDIVFYYAQDWKYFSSSGAYPIPASDPDLHPLDFRAQYHRSKNQSSCWTGAQGRYRRSLCHHMYKRIKKELQP